MADRPPLTPQQMALLLQIVAATPGIGVAHALRQAGVPGSKGMLRQLVADHPELAHEIQEARGQVLRKELIRRAVDGDQEPIVSVKGEIVGYKTVRSDRLLEFACRMYLEEARVLQRGHVEVTGDRGGPIQVQGGVSLAAVAAVLHQARALPTGDSSGPARTALPAASTVLAKFRDG